MAVTNMDEASLISNIVNRVAAYDIRNWGPYPETKEGFRRAAILLPIAVHHGEVVILLTKRSKDLRSHPSATVFPGGMRDHTDSSDIATALREAEEEIGLPQHCVQVLGVLTRGITLPNTVVYPVVGLIPNDFVPFVNPSEVEFAFYMPLKDFITEEKVSYHTHNIRGLSIVSRSITFSNGALTANIWGFTANYCTLLAKIIFGEDDCLPILDDTKDKHVGKGLYDDLIKYFDFVTTNWKMKSHL
ncbi:unnamed protein product [Candidula unifasciata]|uniref:Nudix hydrolase domain-containing protein n=1 Tax=Candidula unifasciata TaxID=100452 RepID=A0A8S3ZA95_9EUPU|nr:unnamed protein product [Candidula unifasciata]